MTSTDELLDQLEQSVNKQVAAIKKQLEVEKSQPKQKPVTEPFLENISITVESEK